VVRTFGIFKILIVTVYTSLADRIKSNLTIRLVTFGTIHSFMHAYQWEGSFVVHFSDVFDDPTLRIVTARTVISNRLIVHILMTCNTSGGSFLECQISMAGFALDNFMLPF